MRYIVRKTNNIYYVVDTLTDKVLEEFLVEENAFAACRDVNSSYIEGRVTFLDDVKKSLDYILNSEREDFENQCKENGVSVKDALASPGKINHVYAYASRAWNQI